MEGALGPWLACTRLRSGRRASGGVRELGGREGVRGVVVEEDGEGVSVVERVGMGIRGEDPTGNRTDYDGFRLARTLTR